MYKIIIIFFLINWLNSVNAQFDWEKISYTHSAGFVADNSKMYYIITIDNKGNGKLEYFRSGNVTIREYKLSRKSLKFLNEKIEKSRIFRIDPKDLSSDNSISSENLYTMTLTLDKEYGEEYENKFNEKNLNENKEAENEKDYDGEKPQVIPVPNNLNPEYKKLFYNLYWDIELMVPEKVWKEAGAD